MKLKLFGLLFIFGLANVNAQSYRIYFNDKGQNLEMLGNPYEYLSPRAIENKAKRNVILDHTDLPVDRSYKTALRGMDIEVRMTSKWFNYALADLSPEQLAAVEDLDFVKRVEAVKKARVHMAHVEGVTGTASINYGLADNQIRMVNGHELHDQGFLGQGMVIAVLDGGFAGVESESAFDSLWMNGRILGSYNFRNKDTNVYTLGSHGTKVLSIMGGQLDNAYAGSAPRASYWLLSSEYEPTERVAEMDNWVAAAEFADSVGADIITSSLGYSTFDGGIGDYTYNDLDGNTTVVTKGADMAAQKGILVIVSAGNEALSSWHHITAPADGDSVLAVGAVNATRQRASFSSVGPTSDLRIKPDVMAQGQSTAYTNSAGAPTIGNGTSFSCPIVSGLASCLWQYQPGKTNMEILNTIRSAADRSYAPNNDYGFGICNFALSIISLEESASLVKPFEVYPNPATGSFVNLEMNDLNEQFGSAVITLIDITGREVYRADKQLQVGEAIQIPMPEGSGVYILSVNSGNFVHLEKIVK